MWDRFIKLLRATDSPYYWIAVFCLMAIAGVTAVGPKYLRRQTQLEYEYHAVSEMQFRQAAGRASSDQPATPDERPMIVRLWPIYVLLGFVFVGSLVGLARDVARHAKTTIPPASKRDPPE